MGIRMAALALTAALLLSCLHACARPAGTAPSPYGEEDFDQSGDVVLRVEYPVYDKSVSSYRYFVENHTGESLTFGPRYEIEVWRDGGWQSLPPAEDAAWSDQSYTAAPGETWENAFSFFPYDYTPADGRYRLVKEIGGVLCRAEFTIGAAEGTEDYGYEPLESLPEELGAGELDCDLVISAAGAVTGGSAGRVAAFLERAAARENAMLRLACYTIEGDPVLYDVIYENGSFLLRRDTTRDTMAAQRGITERRYSFLAADGDYIYLTDYASLAEEDLRGREIQAGRSAVLSRSWLENWEELAALAEEMTAARLAEGGVLARFWNDEGTYWVDLTAGPLDYTVSSRGYGMSRTLREWGDEAGLEIVTVRWESETEARLLGRAAGAGAADGGFYAVFDVGAEQVVTSGVSFWQSVPREDGVAA